MCISMKKFFTVIFLSFVMVSAVILAGCTEIGHSAESEKNLGCRNNFSLL